MRFVRGITAGVLIVAVVASTGCSIRFSTSGGTMRGGSGGMDTSGGGSSFSRSVIERNVKAALKQSVGKEPDSVDCPDTLTASTGATTRCTLTEGGTKYGLTVTVGNKTGANRYHLDVKVDDQPQG